MAGAPKKARAAILASTIAALLAASAGYLCIIRAASPSDRRSLENLLPAPATAAALSVAAARAAASLLFLRGVRTRIRLRLFLHKAGLSQRLVFLRSATDGAWPVDAWVEKRREEAVEPDLEVVDAHHNMYDLRTEPKFGGVDPEEVAALFSVASPSEITEYYKQDLLARGQTVLLHSFGWQNFCLLQPYVAQDFLLDIRNRDCGKPGHSVVASVYMAWGWRDPSIEAALLPLCELAAVERMHAENPTICSAIVAAVDLRRDDLEQTLAALAARPLVRGVRHDLAWSNDPGTFYGAAARGEAARPALRRGLALLSKHGFTFDTYVFHEQLAEMADLARSFPDQVIIVDHAALPLGLGSYTPKGTFPIWEKGVHELARASKNVYMKLSGFGMCLVGLRHNELPVPPSSDQLAADWAPYFRAALAAFGAERCLFASHFPVDKVSCDYTIMWNAYKKIVQDFPVEQKMLLFRDNAKHIYRM